MQLTQEEKANLEDEIWWCRENIKSINARLSVLTDAKNNLHGELSMWKERHAKADMKYALATKLTIYSSNESKEKKVGITKALESILENKDKLKKFIELLEMEGGDLKG